jgi:hypothetical protein
MGSHQFDLRMAVARAAGQNTTGTTVANPVHGRGTGDTNTGDTPWFLLVCMASTPGRPETPRARTAAIPTRIAIVD